MLVSLIVAADEDFGIGFENKLLCHLSADLKYFKATTTGHHIVMGRKTYESIGKPLPNRVNIIITTNPDLKLDQCIVVNSIEDAVQYAKSNNETELFITGGGNVYQQSMEIADRIYLTKLHHHFLADTHFPKLNELEWECTKTEFHERDEKNACDYSFEVYDRRK